MAERIKLQDLGYLAMAIQIQQESAATSSNLCPN